MYVTSGARLFSPMITLLDRHEKRTIQGTKISHDKSQTHESEKIVH